jgi:hypothetical protein
MLNYFFWKKKLYIKNGVDFSTSCCRTFQHAIPEYCRWTERHALRKGKASCCRSASMGAREHGGFARLGYFWNVIWTQKGQFEPAMAWLDRYLKSTLVATICYCEIICHYYLKSTLVATICYCEIICHYSCYLALLDIFNIFAFNFPTPALLN